MEPQKCGEEHIYKVKFNKLKSYKEGEYKSYLRFNIFGKKIGDIIDLTIKIMKKENPDDEMKQYIQDILDFRDQFGLSEEDFPNKRVFDLLKENDFDSQMAFESLYND